MPTHAESPPPTSYSQRTYRSRVHAQRLTAFQVVCQETDLLIHADIRLDREAREKVLACRHHIEAFIHRFPEFATTLSPWRSGAMAPAIVQRMIVAGQMTGVGPMAAVAGAIAESVGRELNKYSHQVVVENGGDIFINTDFPLVAAIFAGRSPLSMKVGINVPPARPGLSLCTSSATVGHSLSRGSADAVCVIARSCALADAAATAIGNRIRSPRDIQPVINDSQHIDGVMGIVAILGSELGAWGQVELVPLN